MCPTKLLYQLIDMRKPKELLTDGDNAGAEFLSGQHYEVCIYFYSSVSDEHLIFRLFRVMGHATMISWKEGLWEMCGKCYWLLMKKAS